MRFRLRTLLIFLAFGPVVGLACLTGGATAQEAAAPGERWLDPHSPLVMRGELHPICDVGIENLVSKLIEHGEKDRKYGECEVNFTPGAKINGRVCTLLRVVHATQRPHFEFYKAEIFIDDQMNIPVRYAAYSWPQKAGEELPVLAEYTYLNVKLGMAGSPILTHADFDPENPKYNF